MLLCTTFSHIQATEEVRNTMNNTHEILVLELSTGEVQIELYANKAPKHVAQIKSLVKKGAYDNVAFHRVIQGFMAQTGDVKYGNKNHFDETRVGTGNSDLPDIPAEFNDIPHLRGTVSMARSANPNSANSQFFICFDEASHLNGQYTAFGKVTKGMPFVDQITKGEPGSGHVNKPDFIVKARIMETKDTS